jgi:5-oxoprolinase (ATP-hydrolysing)
VFVVETPGGGGYASAAQETPAAVATIHDGIPA